MEILPQLREQLTKENQEDRQPPLAGSCTLRLTFVLAAKLVCEC